MATYHVRMSVGNGGKAAAHFKYIERTGKYRRNDKLYSESGHLPSWASSPRDFWERTAFMTGAPTGKSNLPSPMS